MQKRKHVVPGSPLQKRKYGEIAVGIGCHKHVEVVTEEVAFPMGVPSPVAVRLRIMAFAVTGRTAVLPAIADSFFPLLGGLILGNRQGPDALDQLVPHGRNGPGTAADRDGK